jgi:hypothetical protein
LARRRRGPFSEIIELGSAHRFIAGGKERKKEGCIMGKLMIEIPQKNSGEYVVTQAQDGIDLLNWIKERHFSSVPKKSKKPLEAIGLWKGRYDDQVSSEDIQKNWRVETWKRS